MRALYTEDTMRNGGWEPHPITDPECGMTASQGDFATPTDRLPEVIVTDTEPRFLHHPTNPNLVRYIRPSQPFGFDLRART